MKRLVALIAALAMVLSLAGCSGDSTETTAAAGGGRATTEAAGADTQTEGSTGEVTTVTVWSMYAEDEDETTQGPRLLKLAEEFNATHDDIQIEVTLGKTYDNIVTAIASEGTPDIFQMYWQYASPLAANGAILDLTSYVENDESFEKDDILDAVWELCKVGDSIYSIPLSASTTYVLYNPSVLEAAGWSEFPTTVEDLIQCAKDCYDVGGTTQMGLSPIFPWQDDVLWPAMVEAQWEDAEGNPAFDNEGIREAYSLQKELIDYQGGYTAVSAWGSDWYSTRATATDPVLSGACAMRFQADSGLGDLLANGAEAGYEYGTDWAFAAVPGNSMLTAGVYEINAKTAHADAAWEVLSYLSSAESMAYLAEGTGNMGFYMPRYSSLEALAAMDVPQVVKDAANTLMTVELQSFPMSGYVSEYLAAISTHMSQYLSGELDLDTAVANVQAEVEAAAQ